ncbi:MAG: glycosyltransferase family 4 protein [Candidatus Faecousia sp.]|nr:glycosyltransferase family 4 protein [Clostridiales bacterium]MDY6179625.1 glycosyltransferase family 4 protein [Candidatus Faecousia sp.]
MKKVLFVATLVKNHIAEFHLPYLKLFQDMGWETAVAAKNDYENPADCVIPNCDVFYDVPFERSPLKKENLTAYHQVKRIIREGGYDIIHCHTPVGAAVARLAAREVRKNGTKVIYTAHGFHFFKGASLVNWLVYFPVEWLLSPLTDVLITINREDYDRAKRLLRAKRIVYIPGVGIDTARFRGNAEKGAALRRELGIPEEATVLLSVGDLNKNKNHRAVLEALAGMENRNLHYVVCGRGPLKGELEAFAREKGLGDRVHFMGYRNDIPAFYAMADIFVFPSFREGLSVSVMEAMASGLPIACSRIRGNTDMVEDGVNGYLMEPGNPDSIAGTLRRLEDGGKWEEISRNNLEKAEEYSLAVIAEQYRKVYLEANG